MGTMEQIRIDIYGIYDYDDNYIKDNPMYWDSNKGTLYISPLFCSLLVNGRMDIEDDGEMEIVQGLKYENEYARFELKDGKHLKYYNIKKMVLIEDNKMVDEIVVNQHINGEGNYIFKFRCLDDGTVLTMKRDKYYNSKPKVILLDGIKENIEDTGDIIGYVGEVARLCAMITKNVNKGECANIIVKQITCRKDISYYLDKAITLRKWGLNKFIIYCKKDEWEDQIKGEQISIKKDIWMINSKGKIVDEFQEWRLNGAGSDIEIIVHNIKNRND